MDANSLMKNCQFFPSEFSLTITFLKKELRNENEFLFTLLATVRLLFFSNFLSQIGVNLICYTYLGQKKYSYGCSNAKINCLF